MNVANTSGIVPPFPYGDWAEPFSVCENIISVEMCVWSCTTNARESMTTLSVHRPSNQRNHMRLPST
eukprot:14650189-Alexandrium_andersonii.AAC.1